MKSFFALALILLFVNSSCQKAGQRQKEFEGKIAYEVSVRSKTDNPSTQNLQKIYGTRMIKYFKNGNFKMMYNGEDINTIYFIRTENKEFDYRNGIDSLFVTSYNSENRELIQSISGRPDTTILNRKCKLLIHKMGNTANYYWYDPSLYIDPENYKDSKYSFTDVYYRQAKAPWLQYRYEGEHIEINYTAIQISEEQLDDRVFNLPDLPKSYYRSQ